MDFIYLFRVLSERKWIILGAGLIAAFVAYLLTINQPKLYKSTAQVSTGFTVSDEVKVNDNFNFYEAETKFNNAVVTFTSPAVLSLLSYDLMQHDLKSATPFRSPDTEEKKKILNNMSPQEASSKLQRHLDNLTVLNPSKPDEKTLLELLKLYKYDYKTLSEKVNVFRFQRSDYIQIDYASENPELSAYAVNTVYDQFLRYFKRLRSSTSAESIDTLRSIMEKRRLALDQKNAMLKARGIVIAVDNQNNSTFEVIASLQKSLTDEETKRTELQSSLQKINQRLRNVKPQQRADTGNDEVVIAREAMNRAFRDWKANPTDKTLEAIYNQRKSEYTSKVVNSGTATAMARADDPIELEAKKNDIEVDLIANRQTIAALQSKIGGLRGSIVTDASKSAAVQSLIKETEMASKEYLEAKQKYNDAIDINSSAANNFKQVLFGLPAIEPEPSKRMLIVSMAGLAALITTVLIIIAMTYMDTSIKTPMIFKKVVNLKMISMVNLLDLKRKNMAAVIANKDRGVDEHDKRRNNIFRESLRKLRFEVENSGKQIFLFTSTRKGQGKTTLIQALSYSLSLSKKKILIIDTNFCNNDLTVQLDAQPILEKMVPYHSGGKSMLEQVKVLSKDVNAGSVFAIGSEGGDYTPSEILPRENILQHLHGLTSEFDYIFLEGPPLNDFSDSKELAQYVDGVIAIFSAQDIIKQIDKESISFFKDLNGKFCGSVLNMVDLKNVNVT
jgi:polysaccharide biosynthesis transport protein